MFPSSLAHRGVIPPLETQGCCDFSMAPGPRLLGSARAAEASLWKTKSSAQDTETRPKGILQKGEALCRLSILPLSTQRLAPPTRDGSSSSGAMNL